MFTIVIAEQEHIDSIFGHYALFLKPICDAQDVAFCAWNPQGKALSESVPELEKTVGDHRSWRLIIVMNKEGAQKKNPFDYVEYDKSLRVIPEEEGNRAEEAAITQFARENLAGNVREASANYSRYQQNPSAHAARDGQQAVQKGPGQGQQAAGASFSGSLQADHETLLDKHDRLTTAQKIEVQNRRQAAIDKAWRTLIEGRQHQYEQAADNPLVQLVTRLLHGPFISSHLKAEVMDDPSYRAYVEQFNYKEDLRKRIVGEDEINFPEPSEVLCVAMRNEKMDERAIDSIWSKHDESDYSRFADRNLYFEKMRYFVYDIIPNTERRYAYEYVRFLYVLLVMACHELPKGAIRPNRVYRLQCFNDNGSLRSLVQRYDYKLETTQEKLRREIDAIHHKPPVTLTQTEAEELIHARADIVADPVGNVQNDDLGVDTGIIGIAADRPGNERALAREEYKRINMGLLRITGAAARSVRAAVADFHRAGQRDVSRAAYLTQEEYERLKEHADSEELAMVDNLAGGLSDSSRFMLALGENHQELNDTLDSRMNMNTTLRLGGAALGLGAAGYVIPLLQGIAAGAAIGPAGWLLVAALAGGALSAAGCVKHLQNKTRGDVKQFNDRTVEIKEGLQDEVQRYSRYLSHAASYMLANREIQEYNKRGARGERPVQVRRKHIQDIVRRREELREVFGQFMSEDFMSGKGVVTRDNYNPADAYPYDFDRGTEYVYPVPFAKGHQQQTVFIQEGNLVDVPVAFTTMIQAVREEIYDE